MKSWKGYHISANSFPLNSFCGNSTIYKYMKIFLFQKRIVSAETISRYTVCGFGRQTEKQILVHDAIQRTSELDNQSISAHPNIVCVRFNFSSVLKVRYIEAIIRGFEGGYLSRSSISSERREGCFEKCHGLKNWRFRLELKGWPNVCLPCFSKTGVIYLCVKHSVNWTVERYVLISFR